MISPEVLFFPRTYLCIKFKKDIGTCCSSSCRETTEAECEVNFDVFGGVGTKCGEMNLATCTKLSTPRLHSSESCPDNTYVNCIKGTAHAWNDSSASFEQTCTDACGSECCIKDEDGEACNSETTACIKKSLTNPPCNGAHSCGDMGYELSKPTISSGSCVGFGSCHGLGQESSGTFDGNGGVVQVDNSCIGRHACDGLGSDKPVPVITNSCCGEEKCRNFCSLFFT